MTAAVAAGAQRCSGSLDPALYDRRPVLSAAERAALDVVCACRSRWPSEVTAALERLARPIDDVVAHINPQPRWWPRSPTRGALMTAMRDQGTAFWGWDRDRWVRVLAATDADVRQPVMAVGYLLCEQRDLHLELRGFKACLFARRVFGGGAVGVALRRVQDHLDALGYAAQLRRPSLQHALCRLMLAAGSARLEDVARPELLRDLRAREPNNARRHGLEQLARTLVDMRLLAQAPFAAAPTREEWLARSRAGELGVPDVWLGWVKRWFSTSTLTTRSREDVYFMLIKAGRWLAREHPEHADPGTWTRELAAAWVAAVDQMLVGEFSHAPNTDYLRRRHGGQLSPRTKAAHIWALSRFFADLQEWDWIGRRFDPRLTFRTPRSVLALIGPDPRVISDDVWAKLMWAGLNLGVEDLPIHASTGGDPWYPLELVRAVTMLWLFAGLRVDEIVRLRLGAIRWQHEPDAGDERPAVCLLDVPVHKTGTAFTKPVDRTVGAAIDAWQARRPPQPALHDRKTDQPVQLLFAYRGAPLSPGYVNRTLIPILCRKAGVPREDVRGQITGHRARATIASQLYNAKDPMSLAELQAWLGHRSAQSTQHYARITPTKLTKAYSDAGYFARNVRAIEVLLDRDAIQTGAATTGEPYEFYDLGHGYCSYSFFEQCPHRMACARCDFYLPKPSSKAQLLEASTSLQRMLVEIPLNEHERAAVEGDKAAIERLVDRLAQVPTPAGPTPLALTEHTPTTRPESPGVRPPSA